MDDVRPYMEKAQIYLCPMRDGGGTRLKILDALSMGMPIVATQMALEGIHVEPERDVLVADTPAQFVSQLQARDRRCGPARQAQRECAALSSGRISPGRSSAGACRTRFNGLVEAKKK